jgi:hypothetical protein
MGVSGSCSFRPSKLTVLSRATIRPSCTHRMSRNCAGSAGTKALSGKAGPQAKIDLAEETVGGFDIGDIHQLQFLDEPILQGAEHTL